MSSNYKSNVNNGVCFMKTTVDNVCIKGNSYLISTSNIVTDISNDLLELIGYSKDDIVDKDLCEVFSKLLRLHRKAFEQIDIKNNIECYIFTKSLEVREVLISLLQGQDVKSNIYTIVENPNSRLNDKLIFVENLFKENISGVAVFSVPDLILLKTNQKYLDFIDSPYYSMENSIGKAVREVILGYEESQVEVIWNTILETQKARYRKGLVTNKFAREITYWDSYITPIFDNGKMKYIFINKREVTERVVARQEREELEKVIQYQNEEKTNRASELNVANIELAFQNEEKINRASELNVANIELAFQNQEKENRASELNVANIELAYQNEEKENRAAELIVANIELAYQNEEKENREAELIVANKNLEVEISKHKKAEEEITKHEKAEVVIKKLNDELEKKNYELNKVIEMKDEFISLISHEFKTPLTVINSAIQAMEVICKKDLSDKAKGFLNKIKKNSNRQLKLVNNLLDITRLNAGHLKVNKKIFDIVVLSRSITESITIFAEQKNIKLSFSSTLGKKVIGIDDEKYERILLNLLSNAIKFTPVGKSITVKVFQKIFEGKCKVCIQVRDEGIGIPQDKQELIFERFGQVDNSLSRQAEGAGIGLHLVKMLVELLGGEITLESKERLGSTFTILLPIEKAKETPIEHMIKEISDNRLIQAMNIEFSDIYI